MWTNTDSNIKTTFRSLLSFILTPAGLEQILRHLQNILPYPSIEKDVFIWH